MYTDSIGRQLSDRDECVHNVKVIGHIGCAFDPWHGTFWMVAQLLAGELTMTVGLREKTANQSEEAQAGCWILCNNANSVLTSEHAPKVCANKHGY